MKILKNKTTSLLLKSFLINNQDYLSVSILCYFDFNNPEIPLDEQALYRETSEQLEKTILDYAMAKPRAEVLLCGSCHNPLDNEGASHVGLKVGSIEKELYVFGQREWSMEGITKPLPFKRMPLEYMDDTLLDEGYLPNIQDPNHLISSKNDKIVPAGYMPLDMFGEANMKKLGTYDERWKRDFWPGFAQDMDYSFFNTAPQDQQQDSYFEGGETIKLVNMHPEHSVITSTIPNTSMRCFATRKYKDKEDEFLEVKLQRDTLWLFPEIQRGVVIFRGTIAVEDEIYSDLKYLNLKPIEVDEKEKSLDEYYELQKKELDKSIEFDETPFEEADAQIAEAKKEIFDMPRSFKEGVQQSHGKRPTLKKTSAEKVEHSHARIDKAIAQIDESKKKILKMKTKFGHKVKIDTDSLDSTKTKLIASKKEISDAFAKIDSAVKDAKVKKLDAIKEMREIKENPNVTDEAKAKLQMDVLEEKEKVWSDYAFDFLCESVKSLEKEPNELHKLRHLGLAKRSIKRSWVGFNTEEKIFKADEWNLDSEEDIKLPKGLVTARFEEATLKSLRIEQEIILGSDDAYELFLSEGNYNFPLFYLRDDIQAHLCDQEAFDICNTLVCDDISSVTDDAKEALEGASVVFYLQKDGVIDKLFNAKQFDCGKYKDLFELHQNKIEIREQIIENLPKNSLDTLPIKRDVSAKAVNMKVKKIGDTVKEDLKAKGDAIKKEMEQERDKALAEVNKLFNKHGLPSMPQATEKKSAEFVTASYVSKKIDKLIEEVRKKDGVDGIDFKDKIIELEVQKKKMVALAKKGEQIFKDATEKLQKLKEQAKDPIPKWAKDMMHKAGIDPDNPHDTLTREKVISYHADGKSFKTKNLSELDLSELDLSGIDLTQANLKNTNFKNTNLSGAILKQANCTKTNFTSANLSDAKASMSIFKESIFEKAIFNDFEADMALFDKAILKDAKFIDAKLKGVVFKGLDMQNVVFESCELINTSFLKSSVKDCLFNNSIMDKSLFSESSVEDCELIKIESKGILFNKTKVISSNFSHSKLINVRILKNSSFTKCNFRRCNMDSATIFNGALYECNLKAATLNKALIKTSKILNSDLSAVVAKGARFEYSKFEECLFVGINLLKGSLRRMDMKVCDFSHANLYQVEMYKTKLYDVNLDGANLKRSNLEDRVELIGTSDD